MQFVYSTNLTEFTSVSLPQSGSDRHQTEWSELDLGQNGKITGHLLPVLSVAFRSIRVPHVDRQHRVLPMNFSDWEYWEFLGRTELTGYSLISVPSTLTVVDFSGGQSFCCQT